MIPRILTKTFSILVAAAARSRGNAVQALRQVLNPYEVAQNDRSTKENGASR